MSDDNKPAYIANEAQALAGFRARQEELAGFEAAQEEGRRADLRERAAFARAADRDEEEEERASLVGTHEKAGFGPAALNDDPLNNSEPKVGDNEVPDPSMYGKGWIYCGKNARGKHTWLRDNGNEIVVPFSKTVGMSDGQKAMLRQLAQEKGWTQLCAFKKNGVDLSERATQQVLSAGLPCCSDKAYAKTLSDWRQAGLETFRNTLIQRAQAAVNHDLKIQA